MDTELVAAIANAVVERIRADIEKAVLAATVRSLAGGKAVLSRDEAAVVLDLSPRTLEKWASEGAGPRATKFGRSIGHTVEALGEYVDQHQSRSVGPKPRAAAKRRGVKA
ncbi:MAG TPA: DNA-binding protein [Roseiarcus sp.]|jgi:hypothetical protein